MPTHTDSPIYELSTRYLNAGLSIIPLAVDGSKSPDWRALPQIFVDRDELPKRAWSPFQKAPPTNADLKKWWGNGTERGIGIVGGKVSGGLVIIDFDCKCGQQSIFNEFKTLCYQSGLRDQLHSCALVRTPAGGYHLYLRTSGDNCPTLKSAFRLTPIPDELPTGASIEGNLYKHAPGEKGCPIVEKLGRRYAKWGAIETKAEGGYVVAPGSPAKCHASGREYVLVHGDLCDIPTLDAEVVDQLYQIAASLDESPEINKPTYTKQNVSPAPTNISTKPGEDYDDRCGDEWLSYLEQAGWTRVGGGTRQLWRRPGKTDGHSATTNYGGYRMFWSFTSDCHPFEQNKGYSPFQVYAILQHGGDFSAAAKALGERGFGTPIGPREWQGADPAPQNPPSAAETNPDEWGEIDYFNKLDCGEFPIDAFPDRLKNIAAELAQVNDMSIDVCALSAMTVAFAALRGRFFCQVGISHSEDLNLYFMAIMPPGNKKSNLFKTVTGPFEALERELIQAATADNKQRKAKFDSDTMQLQSLQNALKGIKHTEKLKRIEIGEQIAELKSQMQDERPLPQLTADDITPESLAATMAQQECCFMSIMSPEGAFFDNIAGRYTGKPNTNMVTKAYDGDMDTINRKGDSKFATNTAIRLYRPALTMLLIIQPIVIEAMAQQKEFEGKGVLARPIYCRPDLSQSTGKYSDASISLFTQERYSELIRDLFSFDNPETEQDPKRRWQVRLERHSPAHQLWIECYEQYMSRAREDGDGDLNFGLIQPWALKAAGRVARIAALFHICECIDEWRAETTTPIDSILDVCTRVPISRSNVRAAWDIVDYCLTHARAVFGEMKSDPAQKLAMRVVKQLKKAEGGTASARDILRQLHLTKDDMAAAVALLVKHGYVKSEMISPPTGGRKTEILKLHPNAR